MIERRQRKCQRGEIVQHNELGELQVALQAADGKTPVMIGHAHFVAYYRVGDA